MSRCTSRRYVIGYQPNQGLPNKNKRIFIFYIGMEQTKGDSMAEETKELLSCEPERLGHATFLDEEAKEVVLARRTCIEICLTSNLLCVISFFALHFLPRESLS